MGRVIVICSLAPSRLVVAWLKDQIYDLYTSMWLVWRRRSFVPPPLYPPPRLKVSSHASAGSALTVLAPVILPRTSCSWSQSDLPSISSTLYTTPVLSRTCFAIRQYGHVVLGKNHDGIFRNLLLNVLIEVGHYLYNLVRKIKFIQLFNFMSKCNVNNC